MPNSEGTVAELDGTCSDKRCESKGTYQLKATCGNCDEVVIMTLTRDHTTPGYDGGPPCPYCGCRRWHGFGKP